MLTIRENSAQYFRVNRNITLSADETMIESARQRASAENTTLNELFRQWLAHYVAQPAAADSYRSLMRRLSYVNSGGKFSREELNER
jgi:hypothetical protein